MLTARTTDELLVYVQKVKEHVKDGRLPRNESTSMLTSTADELLAHLQKIDEHIKAGRLPWNGRFYPRMVYAGHPTVHVYGNSEENTKYRCVTCGQDFQGKSGVCDACGPAGETYVTNYVHSARWRCCRCSHEWDGEDGQMCPNCQVCHK